MCSSAPAAPSTQTSTVDLPDWAKPYAKETLAKAKALTDINANPYQKYGGNRIAGFQPMQEQAFKTMSGLDAGPEAFAKGIGSYMSPYMQNVVDIEKREAGRQSDIAGTQQQAQATQAGAFGGGRDAIMRAERERNLSQQMGDIQAKGSQAAFDQASNQFRQGITQQSGLAQMQGQMGQQQQQQAQRPLDTAYQDFLNQQNYPYKQLGFMSDMVNKLPLGQKSTSQIYDQGPGTVQTLASLGGAAYGFGKSGMFGAEGGLMESYSYGGVTGQDNKDSIVGGMYSVEDLQKAREAALNRRDLDTVASIDERLQELQAIQQAQTASIDRGLGSAFNQIPEDQQEQMMAGGGMVAFAKGGDTYGNRFEQSLTDLKAMANQAPAEPTPEQRDEAISARIPMLEKRYGPDITQPYLEETKSKRAGLADQMEKDKGLAFAMASLGMLSRKRTPGESQRNQLFSGLGEAGQMFIGEVGKLKKENREVDDKLRQSEILLATAQQSRKEGLINKADAEETRAQDLKRDVFKTKMALQEKVATLESGLTQTEMQGANALKVAGVNAASQRETARLSASKPSTQMEGVAIKAAEIRRQFPDMPEAQVRDKALQAYLSESGKYPSTDRAADARATFYEKISSNVDERLVMDKKYRALQKEDKKTGGTAADQYREQLIAVELDKARSDNAGSQGQPAPGAAPAQQQAAPIKVTSQEQFNKLPSGTTFVAPDGSTRIKP